MDTRAVLIFSPFLLVGLASIAFAIRCILLARCARQWPTTEGEVVSSRVVAGDELSRSEVIYTYLVNGTKHVSSRAQFGDGPATNVALGAYKRIAAYPVGHRVTVRFCPTHPDRSCLEPAISIEAIICLLLGLIAAIIGSGPFWWSYVEPHIP